MHYSEFKTIIEFDIVIQKKSSLPCLYQDICYPPQIRNYQFIGSLFPIKNLISSMNESCCPQEIAACEISKLQCYSLNVKPKVLLKISNNYA